MEAALDTLRGQPALVCGIKLEEREDTKAEVFDNMPCLVTAAAVAAVLLLLTRTVKRV